MAGKLSGNDIQDGTIDSTKLNSTLSNSVGFIKVTSIVYPNSSSNVTTAGNAVIQLVGSGFDSNAVVYINSNLVSNITVSNSSSISVTTPAQNAGTYLLQVKNPNGESIDVIPGITYAEAAAAYTFQGTVSGYSSGGETFLEAVPTFVNIIDKFPFATNANATDVGDLTQVRAQSAGQTSTASGYSSGGNAPPYSNVIDKFPFASNANASDVGDLTVSRSLVAGQSSAASGYTSGGLTAPGNSNVIDKFPFASDANATDVGDLTEAKNTVIGQSSTASGYRSGGAFPFSNTIDKFPFASDANATDVGDLTLGRSGGAGQSSDVSGYTSGGYQQPPTTPGRKNIIDKFPFATNANATDVGDLTEVRVGPAGQSSTASGYSSGGSPASKTVVNVIDKFPFASDANATDVGDLTQARVSTVGQQD